MYIDKNIETRGYVTRVFPSNNIEIQEVSKSLKENNLIPFTIRVHYDKYEIIMEFLRSFSTKAHMLHYYILNAQILPL